MLVVVVVVVAVLLLVVVSSGPTASVVACMPTSVLMSLSGIQDSVLVAKVVAVVESPSEMVIVGMVMQVLKEIAGAAGASLLLLVPKDPLCRRVRVLRYTARRS